MAQLRGRTLSGRIQPLDMDTLPSASVSRGTVATIPAEEVSIVGSPREYRNIRKESDTRTTITSQEMRLLSGTMSYDNLGMSGVTNLLASLDNNSDERDERFRGDLQQFIREHFHQKECCRFVPKDGQKVEKLKEFKCYCGAVLMDHANMSTKNAGLATITEQFLVPKELQRIFKPLRLNEPAPERMPKVNWSPDMLRQTVTSSYGEIDFVNVESVGGKKPAKYIRVGADDSVDKLFDLMQSYWDMMEPTAPSLVISVVGGAKNFKLDGRMRTTFSTGLIKTAKTTSAWLISSGFNMGVMKSVGQAVHQGQSFCWDNDRMTHVLRCIGIAPWGYIRHRRNLESHDGDGKFSAEYRTSNVILHGEPVPLNADHTHFIFVDDGYRNRYGGVAEMRAKIEQKISQPEAEGGLGIPVVLVVVEGGTDAIADARTSLEHRIPVVVCSGTGRAADILAYAYSHTKTVSGSTTREMTEKHISKLWDKIFDAYGKNWKEHEIDDKTEEILESVKICCQKADLMTVFNMNKEEELDLAILSVLLKAQTGGDEVQRLSQLQLAITWNRVDIAQEEIFREDILWRHGSLDGVLTDAIVSDKVQFINLILEQGVIMKEFLTFQRLTDLYSKVPKHHFIYKMLYKLTGKDELTLLNVVDLLHKLLDKFEKAKDLSLEVEHDECIDDPGKLMFRQPYKHLLIYAVLLHRQSLAKFCWEMGDEPVTSAIAMTRLYSSISRQITRNESILRDTINEYKDEFELLATKVLDECNQSDPDKAQMIVERKSPTWNEMTSLQIAAASRDLVYLSAEASQNSILTNWKQGIISGYRQTMLCMLCPVLLFYCMEFANVGRKALTWYQKLGTFYMSPMVIFCHDLFMYLVFLLVQSYMVLVNFRPDYVTELEIICCVWVLTFLIDKIYIFINFPAPTFISKVRDWYGMVSWMEASNYIVCFLGLLLHFLGFYNVTKVMYCINSLIFFIVLTKFYTASPEIGPKLVMILKMVGELRLFVSILLVFLLAYGISSQGLLFHERSPTWSILKDVFYYPYWQLYGEIFFDSIAADDSTTDNCVAGERDCMTFHWMVPFLLAGYLMVGNILLLNLLIAIFSNVFHQIEKNSFEIWKYQMYILVMEYDQKSFLVPPFSILFHICVVIRWFYRRLCSGRTKSKQTLGRRHLEYLQLFEKEMMTNFLRNKKASDLKNLDTRIQHLQKRVDMLTKLIEDEVIGDQQDESKVNFANTIVMTSEGPQKVTSHVSSLTKMEGMMPHAWPSIGNVLANKKDILKAPMVTTAKVSVPATPASTSANLERSYSAMQTQKAPKFSERAQSSPNVLQDLSPEHSTAAKRPVFKQSRSVDNVGGDSRISQGTGEAGKLQVLKDFQAGDRTGDTRQLPVIQETETSHTDTAGLITQTSEELSEKQLEKQKKRQEKERKKRLKKERKEARRRLKEGTLGDHDTSTSIMDMNDVNKPGTQSLTRPMSGGNEYAGNETLETSFSGVRPTVTFNLDGSPRVPSDSTQRSGMPLNQPRHSAEHRTDRSGFGTRAEGHRAGRPMTAPLHAPEINDPSWFGSEHDSDSRTAW